MLSQLGLEGKFVAGYVGTHGMAHALGTILDTADLCRQQVPDGGRFHFILLGEGSEKAQLLRRAGASGLDNVTFLDAVSKDQVARYWSLLDVSIIHLKRTDLFKTVIPSKLFECMAMGIPVLHGVEGESAEIVEREDVGLAFEPENPASLLEALLSVSGDPALRQSLSQNGPQAVRSFDREVLAGKMLALIESVARKDGS